MKNVKCVCPLENAAIHNYDDLTDVTTSTLSFITRTDKITISSVISTPIHPFDGSNVLIGAAATGLAGW